MRPLRDLALRFSECAHLGSEDDFVDVALLMAGFEIVPTVGVWNATSRPEPVERERIEERVRSVNALWRLTREKRQRGARLPPDYIDDLCGYAAGHPGLPDFMVQVSYGRHVSGACGFHLLIGVEPIVPGGPDATKTLPFWTDLLLRLNDALYERLKPMHGMVYGPAIGNNDTDGVPGFVRRRKLVVGWRTWFGQPYVERYGRDFLLGLPDNTETLDDGGIKHAMAAPVLDVVRGKAAVFAPLWPYLDQHGIEAAWPRRPTRGKSPRTQADAYRDLTAFARDFDELARFALALRDGTRVKVLDLPWEAFTPPQRALIVEHLRREVQRELDEHPNVPIRLEMNDVPRFLRPLLDGLAATHRRFSYVVVLGREG